MIVCEIKKQEAYATVKTDTNTAIRVDLGYHYIKVWYNMDAEDVVKEFKIEDLHDKIFINDYVSAMEKCKELNQKIQDSNMKSLNISDY